MVVCGSGTHTNRAKHHSCPAFDFRKHLKCELAWRRRFSGMHNSEPCGFFEIEHQTCCFHLFFLPVLLKRATWSEDEPITIIGMTKSKRNTCVFYLYRKKSQTFLRRWRVGQLRVSQPCGRGPALRTWVVTTRKQVHDEVRPTGVSPGPHEVGPQPLG